MKSILLVLFALPLLALSLVDGTQTVATGGTPVKLVATSTNAVWLTVQALPTNTGTVCVGGSDVLASISKGTCLTAGQAAPFKAVNGQQYDLSTIYIDVTVNTEGVGFTYAH